MNNDTSAVELETTVQPNTTGKQWMKGFIQIITQPGELDALRGANVWRIAAMSLLLFGIVFTIKSYIVWMNPELRVQAATQNSVAVPTDFPITQTIANSIVFQGMFSLVLTSIMFFIVHRIFTNQPLRFLAFIGIVGYSSSIICIGMVATSILQSVSHTIHVNFSLSFLVPVSQSPYGNGFLSRCDVFLLWQYVAIATSITSFLGLSTRYRIGIVIIGLLVWGLFIGSITYLSASALSQTH